MFVNKKKLFGLIREEVVKFLNEDTVCPEGQINVGGVCKSTSDVSIDFDQPYEGSLAYAPEEAYVGEKGVERGRRDKSLRDLGRGLKQLIKKGLSSDGTKVSEPLYRKKDLCLDPEYCEDGVPVTWKEDTPDWQINLEKDLYRHKHPKKAQAYKDYQFDLDLQDQDDEDAGDDDFLRWKHELPYETRMGKKRGDPFSTQPPYPHAPRTIEDRNEERYQSWLETEEKRKEKERAEVEGLPLPELLPDPDDPRYFVPGERVDFPDYEVEQLTPEQRKEYGITTPEPKLRGVAAIDWDEVLGLSRETGVNPAIIGGYQMVESGKNPKAFAFNNDDFIMNLVSAYSNQPDVLKQKLRLVYNAASLKRGFKYRGEGSFERIWKPIAKFLPTWGKRVGGESWFERRKSFRLKNKTESMFGGASVGDSGRRAWRVFQLAASIDPTAAIKAGAWGRYQVLGGHLIKHVQDLDRKEGIGYTRDPDEMLRNAIATFEANPEQVSRRLFINWVKKAGSDWVEKTNNLNLAASVKKYYGKGKESYIAKLGNWYNRARKYLIDRGLMPVEHEDTPEWVNPIPPEPEPAPPVK